MDNVKIILDKDEQINVNGIFYVFNSKYYFMYTLGEFDGDDYVKLYVSQVCKEIKNTPTGPLETGYMLGMEISDVDEWKKVQESITKIVEDKKNNTQSSEIQYLPISMLVNLKVISKNKFKLMKNIVEDNFKINLSNLDNDNGKLNSVQLAKILEPIQLNNESLTTETPNSVQNNNVNDVSGINKTEDDVIIDYRTRFFEEQEKNQQLEEQIKLLTEKLDSIKNIIG